MTLPPVPALAGWRVDAVLRDRPPVYVARIIGPAGTRILRIAPGVTQLAARLTSAGAALAGTGYGVATPLYLDAAHHLLIMTKVPGHPLADALDDNRHAALTAAAGWLDALTQNRSRGRFGPRFWLSLLDNSDDAGLPHLAIRVRTALARMAPSLAGASVLRATGHGDFVPDNLFWDGSAAVHGIDLSGGDAAIALDLARMRAWLASRSGAIFWQQDRAALTILPPDQAGIAHFLTGVMLIQLMRGATHRPDRVANLAEAMQAWLDDAA